jgi:hypothetical protein
MTRFALVEENYINEHRYSVYDIDENETIPRLAAMVRELYVEPDVLRHTLEQAVVDLGDFLDPAMIDELIRTATNTVIPEAGTNPSHPWLDMARNETAEVLAYLIAEEIYNVRILSKRVRNKEIPRLPSRGVDMVGLIFDDPGIRLVCGEVKTSSSRDSPPSVVSRADDSLDKQLLGLIANKKKILEELTWSHKHAEVEDRRLIGRAMILHAQGKLPTMSFALLVRPRNVYKPTDFGTLRDTPERFHPSSICFSIARLSDSLENFAHSVYSQAKGAE